MKKRVAVLGATGSIGKSALDVLARDSEKFEVVLLTAHSQADELKQLQIKHPSAICILTNKKFNAEKEFSWDLISNIKEIHPDIVVNGISGAAGLEPSIAAIEAGSTLALANKETIVMAGELVLRLAKEKNVKIIPVDSEHSAIFHLLEGLNNKTQSTQRNAEKFDPPNSKTLRNSAYSALNNIHEIILTASGGPFKDFSLEQMEKVTVQDALAHPTWNMGPKITVDSASMANKGLEIIEACAFFNMPQDKIKVTIHRQSIVHSMIRLTNGVIYAQLSKPDMRNPIADALYWPEISPPCVEPLNFDNLTLDFEKPDIQKFPMLILAYEAARLGRLYPAAFNAANEEAVSAFINSECGFMDIPKITEYVLQKDWSGLSEIQSILQADKNARLEAVNFLKKMR